MALKQIKQNETRLGQMTQMTQKTQDTKTITNARGEVFYKTVGTVKSFNKETGYGFIFTIDEPDADIYVHATQIITDGEKVLHIGDEVQFIYKKHEHGFRAYEVKVIKSK